MKIHTTLPTNENLSIINIFHNMQCTAVLLLEKPTSTNSRCHAIFQPLEIKILRIRKSFSYKSWIKVGQVFFPVFYIFQGKQTCSFFTLILMGQAPQLPFPPRALMRGTISGATPMVTSETPFGLVLNLGTLWAPVRPFCSGMSGITSSCLRS